MIWFLNTPIFKNRVDGEWHGYIWHVGQMKWLNGDTVANAIGILLFIQTVSLIPKVNIENTPTRINLRDVS